MALSDDFDSLPPADGDELADPDVLAQYDQDGLTWTVYRGYQDGEEINERGGRAARAYVTKISGRIDIHRLASIVGPGTWKLFGKVGNRILKVVTVTIEGQPWASEAFNRPAGNDMAVRPAPVPVSPAWAPPGAPRMAGLDPEMAAFLRNEIRAALGGISPGYPMAPPPAAPTDPMLLLNVALQMAEKMNQGARPATDVSQLFGTFVDAFEAGIKQGNRMGGGGESDGNGMLGTVMKELLPVLMQGRNQGAPVSLRPPAGQAPASISMPPASISPAPAPAPALPAPAWGPRDHVIAALFKVARDGVEDAGTLAAAVEFYLDGDQDFESFQALGEADGFQDAAIRAGLVGWVGAASVMGPTAKVLADAPTVGDIVRRVQLAMLEADQDVPEKPDTPPAE